ncbi:MAG: Uma2 family endonuclease [Spirochaetales bacterium]|jgi:Uma2 family endonuclease|nr:Uma2 family endonuclease [Spirochaetales bacterium]
MPLPLRKIDDHYTYADYKTWPEDERWELIDGVAWNMSPAPTRKHQGIITNIIRELSNYLKDKNCNIYGAPFDVRLPDGFKNDAAVNTVVQPDITVFCDKKRLDDRGAVGAPDLVVEVLSPSTAAKDLREKFSLYENVGVKEYWIVDPSNETLTVYVLDKNGKYPVGKVYAGEDRVKVNIFEDLEIKMEDILINL